MASFHYMIIGTTNNETGSMDTYFDGKRLSDRYGYAYIGGATGSSTPPTWDTWSTGSKADVNDRDAQMYTPYPTGTKRGKLYWVETGSFEEDFSIPNRSGFVNLEIPPSGSYYVITPSLNDGSFQSSGKFAIAQYAFIDEDDLWENGWKCQNGTPLSSNPIITQADWVNIKSSPSWIDPPFNFDNTGATPGDRAQIVANILALTPNSFAVQTGFSITDYIKGAIVLAGKTTPFDNDTYKNLVPLKN